MPELPAGTVTFLFTDIEGSTKLLHEFGAEGYAEALAEHRRVIREACVAHGGVEVDTQGDAFFFAFPTAPGALAAAGEMTEALAPGPIQVRIGIHTGTPLLTGGGYVGGDVHRAARVAAAGHGGQVLVSASTAPLVELELRDLGEHRFKDLGAPERVYQLGGEEFPALKSLYRTNLPVPATAFVGRERQVAEAVELLSRGDIRLLTLTGPGGTGKTRLAIQVAAEASELFPDGLYWVPLAPLRDRDVLLPTVAQVLGVTGDLKEHLAGKRMLLLLDNVEHLLPDAAADVALLRDAGGPTLLVTSRERLQLQGEHEASVFSMDEQDAFELLQVRAGALGVQLDRTPAAVELIDRLDRLPLALELAAARLKVFSPEQLLDRLTRRLDLLKGGRDLDPRQQTLRATIQWSYDLLEPEERRLFRRLSVFAGSCAYGSADSVCEADPDTLQSLVDKSLLRRRDASAGPRYWMLETIREYAAELLSAQGEGAELRDRHAVFVLEFVQTAGAFLIGRDEATWVDRLEEELPNIRAALIWRLQSGNGDQLAQLATPIARFWQSTSRYGEERRWYESALDLGVRDDGLRMQTVGRLGNIDYRQGRYVEALAHAEEHLDWARTHAAADELFFALMWCANAAMALGMHPRASALYEESVAAGHEAGDISRQVMALANLGDVALIQGDYERALALSDQSVGLLGDAEGSSLGVVPLINGAAAAFHLGRFGEARGRATRALRASRDSYLPALGPVFELFAALAACGGDGQHAAMLIGAADAFHEQVGDSLEPTEEALRAQTVKAIGGLEGTLGDAWRAGLELTVDETVALVLESID